MRRVRICSVSFLVDDVPTTVEANLERAEAYLRHAAASDCDLVVLPEMFRTVNTSRGEIDPEPHPGPTLDVIAHHARNGAMNIAATYYVSVDNRIFNQTVIVNRFGDVVGEYRKVQPTALEALRISAGNDLPVFTLDFGRIAVMICIEIYFPEIARIYAHKGAEILLWPTVTLGPTSEGLLAQATSRAIDNGLVVVESNMASPPPFAPYAGHARPGTSRIIAPSGEVIASTARRDGLAVADVDLDDTSLTSTCVLIREPDHFRTDLESISRLDLYAREYARIAGNQNRHEPYWRNISED